MFHHVVLLRVSTDVRVQMVVVGLRMSVLTMRSRMLVMYCCSWLKMDVRTERGAPPAG